MDFLVLINTVIFILLCFLHIFWALGGNWGMNAVLPTITEEQRTFKPGLFGTIAVGAFMGLFAFITIGNTGFFDDYVPHNVFKYATLVIGILFLLRAIGDFRYIGFFKKANGTQFAKNDTRYYSPLCVLIAAICLGIVLL